MNARKQRLILEQIDRKLQPLLPLANLPVPPQGWVHTIRTALHMSLRQLAGRLGKTPQTLQAFETREQNGTITLKSLKEIAEALDLQLVYALIPKEGTLEAMVDRKALEKAHEIVDRTDTTMHLEKQSLQDDRLRAIIMEKKNELKTEMSKLLWD